MCSVRPIIVRKRIGDMVCFIFSPIYIARPGDTHSPGQDANSPRQDTKLPEQDTNSPGRDTNSPGRDTNSY